MKNKKCCDCKKKKRGLKIIGYVFPQDSEDTDTIIYRCKKCTNKTIKKYKKYVDKFINFKK